LSDIDLNTLASFQRLGVQIPTLRGRWDVPRRHDLPQTLRAVVTVAEAEQFAEHHHLKYLETSAASGINVREAFVKAATEIHRKGPQAKSSAKVAPVTRGPESKGCCG
jgi:hypothetical protein